MTALTGTINTGERLVGQAILTVSEVQIGPAISLQPLGPGLSCWLFAAEVVALVIMVAERLDAEYQRQQATF